MSLLEKKSTKKGRINKLLVQEFESDNNKEYEMEAIQNIAIEAKKVNRYLSRLYYLVAWKNYPEKENT